MIDSALRAIVMSLLIGIAALLLERAARSRGVAVRFVWLGAMLASLFLSFAAHLQWPTATTAAATPLYQESLLPAIPAIELPPIPWSTLQSQQQSIATPELVFRILWFTLSMAMLSFLAVESVRNRRRRTTWQQETSRHGALYTSHTTGPAVFGFLHPSVVVPMWFGDLPPAQRMLILAHERSHIAARDPLLLLTGFMALAAVPWNLPLWWLFVRLRRAIELDCDQRMLDAGAGRRSYAETLIAVAERSRRDLAIALCMARTSSLLRRRILIMSESKSRASRLLVVSLIVAAAITATAATQVRAPTAASPPQLSAVDTATLERYLGAYEYSETTVMRVERAGDHLQVRFTGQDSPDDVYPQSETTFFYVRPDVHATIEFTDNGAVLRQNGAETSMQRLDPATANAIEGAVAERVAAQSANVRSEGALRRLIADIYAGRVDERLVNPQLAGALRHDLPKLQVRLAQLGQPSGYSLQRVNPSGGDAYLVSHEHGTSEWSVVVDGHGTITGATVPLASQ
jgi:bla regulator protein blaR1